MKRVSVQRWVGSLLTLAVMLLIFFMSAQDGTRSSDTSGGVVALFLRLFVPGFGGMEEAEQLILIDRYQHLIRKGAHFTVYLMLGLTVSVVTLTLEKYRLWQRLGISALVGLLYAASDEFHQTFVPGRAGMVTDVLLDVCGVLTGLLLLRLSMALICYLRQKRTLRKI